MRCGRLSVEGEAEEVSPRTCRTPRRQQSRNKKDGKVRGSNPYAARGLEKFAILNEELAAKRVYIARKTGAPEDLVRFCYSTKGWVPVVVRVGKSGGGDARVSILRPLRRKKDGGCEENEKKRRGNEDGSLEIENGYQNPENAENQTVQPVVFPWCGYLRFTAFGVMTVSALMVRKSVVPAAAMAAVMVVCALRKRWQGGVMCMKRFIVSGMSFLSDLIVLRKKKMMEKKTEKIVEKEPEIVPQKEPEKQIQIHPQNVIRAHEIRKKQRGSLSVSPSLLRRKNDTHQSMGKNKKEIARIVSMDGQPRRPIISDFHKSESFNRSFNQRRSKKGGVGPTVGATVMIVVLVCLVFYGRIFAILVTSAWWYLLPMFRIEEKKPENGDLGKTDLKQRDLRKKRVIMDGLLDRSHKNNKKMERS